MPNAREKLLAAITRLEDRHYTYYPKDNLPALLNDALAEAREKQRKTDALIAEREYYRNQNGPDIARAILRGGEPGSGGEKK